MVLNHYSEIAKKHIEEIPAHHNGVFLIQYVIMPNHIHLIIELDNQITLPITTVIGLLKSGISREIGFLFGNDHFMTISSEMRLIIKEYGST